MTKSRQKPALLWLVFGILGFVPRSFAQISVVTMDNLGRWHSCKRSGLRGWSQDCGFSNLYSYIFIGTVLEADPEKDGETSLKVRPEEMFLGEKVQELTFSTSQGDCLPAFHAGDRTRTGGKAPGH